MTGATEAYERFWQSTKEKIKNMSPKIAWTVGLKHFILVMLADISFILAIVYNY